MFEPSKSYDYFSVGGVSVANGFDLDISTVLGHREIVEFRVPGTDEETSRRFDWPVALLVAAAYILAIHVDAWWPKVFILYLLFTSFGTIFERSYKSWHWVEHQAALWLEGELTERFDSIDPLSTRCGSTFVVARALLLSSIIMVALDYGWWATPVFVSSLATWTAYHNRTILPVLRPWIRRCLVVCAWPATLVCLGAQRLLFMRRPALEHRLFAKRWAKSVAPLIAMSLIMSGPPRIVKVISPRTF